MMQWTDSTKILFKDLLYRLVEARAIIAVYCVSVSYYLVAEEKKVIRCVVVYLLFD